MDVWGKFHKALKKEDWPDAVTCINRIIGGEPRNPNHYLKKGDISRKMDNRAEAVDCYLKAASCLNDQGFFKKSLAVYKMIMRLDPDNAIAVEKANAILSELEAPRKFAVPGFQPAFEKPEMSSAATDGEKGTDEAPTGAPVSEGSDHSPGPDAEGAVDLYATGMIEPTSVRGPSGDTLPESDDFIEPAGYATENPASAPASHPEFLSPFTDEEIGEIVTRSAVKGYSAGETIVREGDTGTSVFLIKQGRVSVVSHIFGREINLATLSAGDLFGEVAFLTGRPRTANVIATEAAEVYKINKDLLDEIIEKRPEIMSQVNEIYNERVQDTIRKIKE